MGWCKKTEIKKNCMASCGFCQPVMSEDDDDEAEVEDNKTVTKEPPHEHAVKPYVPSMIEVILFALCLGCLAYTLLVAS